MPRSKTAQHVGSVQVGSDAQCREDVTACVAAYGDRAGV